MSASPLSSRRAKIIFSIVWLALLADHAALMYWYGFSFKIAIIDAVVGITHLVLASLLLINTLRYYLPQKERFIHLIGWCVFLTAIIVSLKSSASFAIFSRLCLRLSFSSVSTRLYQITLIKATQAINKK